MLQALLRQMIRFINELDIIWKEAVLARWTKENNEESQKKLSICRDLTRVMQSNGANSRGYLSKAVYRDPSLGVR
jgi:hypothetical protein